MSTIEELEKLRKDIDRTIDFFKFDDMMHLKSALLEHRQLKQKSLTYEKKHNERNAGRKNKFTLQEKRKIINFYTELNSLSKVVTKVKLEFKKDISKSTIRNIIKELST